MISSHIEFAVATLRSALQDRQSLTANKLGLDSTSMIASHTWEHDLKLGASTNRRKAFSFSINPFAWLEIYDDLALNHTLEEIIFTEAGPVGIKATSDMADLSGCMQALAQRQIPGIFLKSESAHALLGLSILSDEIATRVKRPKGLIHYFETILNTASDKAFRGSAEALSSLKAAGAILEKTYSGVSFIGRKGATWPRLEYLDAGSYDEMLAALSGNSFESFRPTRSFLFEYDAESLCLRCFRECNRELIGAISFPFEPTPALCLVIRNSILRRSEQLNSQCLDSATQHFELQELRSVA